MGFDQNGLELEIGKPHIGDNVETRLTADTEGLTHPLAPLGGAFWDDASKAEPRVHHWMAGVHVYRRAGLVKDPPKACDHRLWGDFDLQRFSGRFTAVIDVPPQGSGRLVKSGPNGARLPDGRLVLLPFSGDRVTEARLRADVIG